MDIKFKTKMAQVIYEQLLGDIEAEIAGLRLKFINHDLIPEDTAVLLAEKRLLLVQGAVALAHRVDIDEQVLRLRIACAGKGGEIGPV